MKFFIAGLYFVFFLLTRCWNVPAFNTNNINATVNHQVWTKLLAKHVDKSGMVNYISLQKDSSVLNNYVRHLSKNPPNDNWNKAESKAYWLNAYNAFTIKLIIDNYPIESIKDLNPAISVPFFNSIFDKKFIAIQNEKLSLNDIEHGILRKRYNDPRIHFAINCASLSCPKIRNEAYEMQLLEKQLNEQAIDFINDSSKNRITENEIEISKVFLWFKSDFTQEESLINFLNRYSKTKINSDAKIRYKDYDWSLNSNHNFRLN